MARRIFSGILIALSFILLAASLVGIGAVWYYKEPLTKEAVGRLGEVETQLAQTQTALQNAKTELERTLRIVDTAEETLKRLSGELAQAKKLFDEFDQTMGDKLIPGLESSKARLNSVRQKLEDLRAGLKQLNSLPIINLNLPGDEMLGNLIETVNSLDTQIDRLKELADRASTFSEDISLLMGGDLSETRQRLQTFLQVVTEYEQKVDGWHTQVVQWIALVPVWIERASIILTIFLLWFAFSQFGLLVHALTLWRGGDPFAVLRGEPVPVVLPPGEAPVVVVEEGDVIVAEEEMDEEDEHPMDNE